MTLGVSVRLKVKRPLSATGLSEVKGCDEAERDLLCRRAVVEGACLALAMAR